MSIDAELKQVSDLLKEGRPQEASDLLAKLRAVPASDGQHEIVAEPAAPREPYAVIYDLFVGLVAHVGNPAHLESLLYELESVAGLKK